MIDGIKIVFYCINFAETLIKLGIDRLSIANEDSGELSKKRFAVYRGLIIKWYPSGRVVVSGSLHKYWKDENYSDFTFADLCLCINDLCEKMQISPLQARICNLEFGVNVCPNFIPISFCEALIAYKKKSFRYFDNNNGTPDIGFESRNLQYRVKCYDKGQQQAYFNKGHILRIEVATKKMISIKRAGIKTLADLQDLNKLKVLGSILQAKYSDVIVDDVIELTKLTEKEQAIYQEGSNPKNWAKFNYRKRYKMKSLFQAITSKYGQHKWKNTTALLLAEKLKVLLPDYGGKG